MPWSRSWILRSAVGFLVSPLACGFVRGIARIHRHPLVATDVTKERYSGLINVDHYNLPSLTLLSVDGSKYDDLGSVDGEGQVPRADTRISATPQKKSVRRHSRVGGRQRRREKQQPENHVSSGSGDDKGRNWVMAGLLLALVVTLSNLFGGGNNESNPSYVYYQSTVFESTVIRENGRRETSRQESFRSNLPELVRQQQRQDDSRTAAQRLLPEADQETEIILNGAMEMQRRMLNDFF